MNTSSREKSSREKMNSRVCNLTPEHDPRLNNMETKEKMAAVSYSSVEFIY